MERNTYLTFLVFLLMLSCSKEKFATNRNSDAYSTPPIDHYSAGLCANYTMLKPKVDFLFLWDNSSSQFFVTEETKRALRNTIESISVRFDYHILLAPLIGTGNNNTYLVVENPDGLNSAALSKVIPQSSASSVLGSFPSAGGSIETGFDRTIELLQNNVSNGIFRQNAYTMTVLMSNGDDFKRTGSGIIDKPQTDVYVEQKKNLLLNIRNNILHSLQFRFMSLVAFSNAGKCVGFIPNYAYKQMSSKIYFAPYTNGMPSPTDQSGRGTPDSYDICGINFVHLFDGINNSIQDVIDAHKYDYWPVAASGAKIDTEKITAVKSTGYVLNIDDTANGFKYIGDTTRNTRYAPTPGEPYTGHLIQLFGKGRISYPECLIVKTQSPADYYGYFHLHSNPVVSSIDLTINDRKIPQSKTNGWEFIGYKQSQNLKIVSPTDYTPALPAENKTGYFLKLYGDAVYSNGASINVTYDPAAK